MRDQTAAADNPATQGVAQFAADFAQGTALRMPPAHGLPQLRVDPPEISRGVLDKTTDFRHVRHIAQALEIAVGRAARQVIDVGAGGQTVGVECAPGQAVIGAQADIAPVQVEVGNGPRFVAAAGGVMGLVADACADFAGDTAGLSRARNAPEAQ